MARGLQFNPWNGMGNADLTQNTSVPSVASDYYYPQLTSPLSLQWNPEQLKKAQDFVNWSVSTPLEDQDSSYFLKPLNKWNQGLRGLNRDELDEFENSLSDNTRNQLESYKERVWKNRQFVKDLGMDLFNATPDADKRDEIYKDYLLDKAVSERYHSNSNLDQLRSLSADGKMNLLKSDYKSDWQLKQEREEAKDKDNISLLDYVGDIVSFNWGEVADATKKWADHSLMERWNAITSNAVSQGQAGMGIGSVAGGIGAGGVGTIPGLAIGGAAGMLSGVLTGIAHPEDGATATALQKKVDNENTLNKIIAADNEKKKEGAREDTQTLLTNYLQAYNQGQISEDEVNSIFDEMALNGKRTTEPDELGNTEEYDYTGSNYYSAFKDSDEFEHFTVFDKLKYLAQTQALANKYGRASAMSILEQDMQNYVSDHQDWKDWGANTLKNVWVGGIANLGLNWTALQGLAAYNRYGAEGAINYLAGNDNESADVAEAYHNAGARAEALYLQGKDASGNGEDNWWINNPSYWNKVDQYNDLGWDMSKWLGEGWGDHQEEAERNGGISTSINVTRAGEEGDPWSWNTLNEAIRMNKFAWSDLVKNLGLAKIVRGATRLARGTEIAPGILTTESSAAAQSINKWGSIGVMNASSLGIDAAYGMQTFDDVLRENNSKLDQIIEKDVEKEVAARLQTPQAQMEFQQFVDAENQRRKQNAGETGKWIPVDEEEAWKAYINHTEKVVRQEQEEAHAKDREQAELDAANAYIADATIEHIRMATTNGAFKSYLFDKGTLNALRANNPYVNTTFKDGAYALGKNATRRKALGTLATNVWGGFHSNYFDDVTVGFAKGFGLQDYNNYLLQKYNPAAYGSVIDEYVNPFLAGMMGAEDAMTEGRSFLDGGIGALGTVFTAAPNIHGMMNHRERMKQLSESIEKSGSKEGIHWTEMLGDFINNPMAEAVANAKQATRMTEAAIKRANDAIKEHGYAFDNIVEVAAGLNQKAVAREGTSLIEAEDAKDREAFALATALLDMKNNGAVVNAQAEPDKAGWSKKKKAANAIGNAINRMFGIPVYEDAESSFTRAMNTLQEASAIGEGELTETQQELIDTFLGLDTNKSAVKDMSAEEKSTFAQERLKKNATNLLDMMNRAEEVKKKFENSVSVLHHPDVQQQLLYQYVLDSRWKGRLEELEKQIIGEEDAIRNEDKASIATAKYGSKQGWERSKKAQEKKVEQAENLYKNAQEEAKKENDPAKSMMENMLMKSRRFLMEKTAKEILAKEKSKLLAINKDGVLFNEENENAELPVVKAEDILRLSADDRLRMLDDYYRNDYSQEQQQEIDRAKTLMMQDGSTINQAMERVRDAAILTHRIEDNMEAAKKIMQNPAVANEMQVALNENRKRAVIDYFNDKVVNEAFEEFAKDPASLLSEEAVAEKARNYSSAVLNGMQKVANRELQAQERGNNLTDKTLQDIVDGINIVLKERGKRMEDTVDMDDYLRKTKKVTHTETKPVVPIFDKSTGSITGFTSEEQVTSDRELSDNDRKLIDYALDYAAERGYSIDELPERTTTDDFGNYAEERNHAYQLAASPAGPVPVNVGTVENRANPVSPEYMRSLMEDVISSYKANKEETAKAKAAKQTDAQPRSVATAPVQPQTQGDKAVGEKRADEVAATNDPFGIKGKKAERPAEAAKQTDEWEVDPEKTITRKIANEEFKRGYTDAATEEEINNSEQPKMKATADYLNGKSDDRQYLIALGYATGNLSWLDSPRTTKEEIAETVKRESEARKKYLKHKGVAKPSRNTEILDKASAVNADILSDISTLLDEVDKLNVANDVKNTIKDTIEAYATQSGLKNIKELQDKVAGDLGNNKFEVSSAAWQLQSMNISAKTKAAAAQRAQAKADTGNDKGNNKPKSPFNLREPSMVLETLDFDVLYKYYKEFVDTHKIGSFLQKLYNAWKDDNAAMGKRHQAQAVFIYDPELARQVSTSIGEEKYKLEQDAPVIMALEITDANRDLIENDSQLIEVKDVPNGRSHFYQPLGIMPSNTHSANATESRNDTAAHMAAIRSRIYTTDKFDRPITGPVIIRVKDRNGTPIQGNLNTPKVDVTEGNRPAGTAETPKTNIDQLMEDNLLTPSERLADVGDAQIAEYEDAKKKGLFGKLRNTGMYKKMKEVFIKRTFTQKGLNKRTGKEETAVYFNIRKGTNDSYPVRFFERAIGPNTKHGAEFQSYDRNNPGRTIVSLLKDIDVGDETSEEKINKADELLRSNSRFDRLFDALHKLKFPEGLFTNTGVRAVSNFDTIIGDFESAIRKSIDNNFNVDDLSVKVDFTEREVSGNIERDINIHILSADDELSSITLPYKPGTKIEKTDFATLMKHMILGEDGNTRRGINHPDYERVKWQVTYADFETAKDDGASNQSNAEANLSQLFDDGILTLQETKLAYPAKTVSINLGRNQLGELYNTKDSAQPDGAPASPTETKAAFEAETNNGKVDSDSGTFTEPPTKETLLNGLAQSIKDTIKRMISNSESRNIDDNNEGHYNILGRLYSRVTSIKYAMKGLKDRFNPNSGWALPSSALGDSFDEFGRDVFNGIFDNMSEAEKSEVFKTYDNSTEKNYAKTYQALKEFEARLRSKGQVIIATGKSREHPGKITVMGTVDVTVNKNGKFEARKVRVAGTLDVLAVDKYGNLHIYDFKTHRVEEFNKGVAIDKGYDRQLSMYAEFLEKEYGLPVASISIIPVRVNYDTPDGINNDGTPIEHPEKHYKKAELGNQLLWTDAKNADNPNAAYQVFDSANFQVEEEFELPRLTGDDLIAAYEKMTTDEIAALEDAVLDQSDNPASDNVSKPEVVGAKPEVVEKQKIADEDQEGPAAVVDISSMLAGLGISGIDSVTTTDSNAEGEALNDISPENSLLSQIEEQKKDCAHGPKQG